MPRNRAGPRCHVGDRGPWSSGSARGRRPELRATRCVRGLTISARCRSSDLWWRYVPGAGVRRCLAAAPGLGPDVSSLPVSSACPSRVGLRSSSLTAVVTCRSRGSDSVGPPPSPRVLHRLRGVRSRVSQFVPDRQQELWRVAWWLSRGWPQLTRKSQAVHRLSPASPQNVRRWRASRSQAARGWRPWLAGATGSQRRRAARGRASIGHE